MGKTKVLFVIPPFLDFKAYANEEITSQAPCFTIPYGILSIAAYAKAHSRKEVQFSVLDLNLYAYSIVRSTKDLLGGIREGIETCILEFKPDIVAISALFNSCYDYLDVISSTVKKIDEKMLTVIGGGLATNLPGEILKDFKSIDAVCFAEGEIPFTRLLDAEDRRALLAEDLSWITRTSLRAGRAARADFVMDLDEIPFFDFSLIDLSKYANRSLNKQTTSTIRTEMSIHTSRGCPFNCVFCANGKVHGKKVRFMNLDKVISEITEMVQKFNISVLLVEDDHFLADKERAKQILAKIASFGLQVEFPNGIAVHAIDEEIGALLKKAGVTIISLAIESGSDYVLKKVINKPLSVRMIKPAVDILKKNDIDVHAFIVMGCPGEKAIHRAETRQMLYDVGFDWVKIFIAIPIAGSRLYDICKEKGYLTQAGYCNYVATKCVINAPDIKADELEDEVYKLNLDINFVNNYNLRSGFFKRAATYLENIVRKYPDHAFGHYALAVAYHGMGKADTSQYHKQVFRQIVEIDPKWHEYAKYFSLAE